MGVVDMFGTVTYYWPVSIYGAYMTLLYTIRNSNGLSLIPFHFTLPWNYLNGLNFSSPFNLESGNGKKGINNLLQGAHWYETAPIDSKRTLVEWWNGSQQRGDLLNFGYWVFRFDLYFMVKPFVYFPTAVMLFRLPQAKIQWMRLFKGGNYTRK